MNTRRDFLKVGALFVPAVVAPRVAYSFLWAPRPRILEISDNVSGSAVEFRGPKSWAVSAEEKLAEFRALGWIA